VARLRNNGYVKKTLLLPPEQRRAELKFEAARIQSRLKARKRAQRQAEISAYAVEMAGSLADLDPLLERAALLNSER
jgi:hypothetical protein